MNTIYVADLISSKIAVSPDKGEILYNSIKNEISNKNKVNVSFKNIEDLTTAFLNKAIGNLYNCFTSESLNEYLSISDLDDLDKYLLNKVITRAKIDIKTDETLRKNIDEVFDNE